MKASGLPLESAKEQHRARETSVKTVVNGGVVQAEVIIAGNWRLFDDGAEGVAAGAWWMAGGRGGAEGEEGWAVGVQASPVQIPASTFYSPLQVISRKPSRKSPPMQFVIGGVDNKINNQH